MQEWRIMLSPAGNGPENMAIDEALFLSAVERGGQPTLRVYCWSAPCFTIGYFQQAGAHDAGGLPVTRRLTGGLTVRHGADLSYALIADHAAFPQVYDQSAAYQLVHTGIRNAVRTFGIPAEFHVPGTRTTPVSAATLCVQSHIQHDLLVDGIKIAGSCQRRRGDVVLIQGSLHQVPTAVPYEQLSQALITAWTTLFAAPHAAGTLSSVERHGLPQLREKYASAAWNGQR
jgi:lipoate-protein ligase A